MINRIADGVAARSEEIARILTQEQGMILEKSRHEIMGMVGIMRSIASMDLADETLKDDATGKIVTHYTALGVVAAIMPWNAPLVLLSPKMTPALLAGNTMIIKPAPTTPLTTLIVAEIVNAILPPGVVNVICDQNDLGAMLTAHPDIAKISFTGSIATGKKVAQSGASALKRVTLELGGNDAAIVLDDVDPRELAPKLFAAAMMNSGQICLAIKRVYAPESLYDELCDELAKLADATIIGNGLEEGVQYGPLQNKQQFDKVKGYLADAHRDGTVIAGGIAVAGSGYFIRPTIVRDISDDSPLVREEQFGPVLPILKYTNLDDAIARANDTEYGLGGTVWSKDPEKGLAVAKSIASGLLWVNQHMVINPGFSVGGAKQSGLGRELGLEGLREFVQQHTIYVAA
jgi:acyl-CoA reductase-like NAD-dependent aldehyde dehydrogenase